MTHAGGEAPGLTPGLRPALELCSPTWHRGCQDPAALPQLLASPTTSPGQPRWARARGNQWCWWLPRCVPSSVLIGTELRPQICHLQGGISCCTAGSVSTGSSELPEKLTPLSQWAALSHSSERTTELRGARPKQTTAKDSALPPCQHLTSAFSCSQITAYLLMWQSRLRTLLFSCRQGRVRG